MNPQRIPVLPALACQISGKRELALSLCINIANCGLIFVEHQSPREQGAVPLHTVQVSVTHSSNVKTCRMTILPPGSGAPQTNWAPYDKEGLETLKAGTALPVPSNKEKHKIK